MGLTTDECIAAIEAHSAGFAEATRDSLAARVRHCPDWTVADLVWHLTSVHWLWATIAEEQPDSFPDEARRPERPGDDSLVDAFVAGAGRLADVLRGADQAAPCWTWAPLQQDVGFITRHQVQEAAVHHWDAVDAAGGTMSIEPALAADAVAEFLTFSVASDADPADPPRPSLRGTFALHATDTGDTWTVTDGTGEGTVAFSAGTADAPCSPATASDLLLWLYGRADLDTAPVPDDLVARFRALCFTS